MNMMIPVQHLLEAVGAPPASQQPRDWPSYCPHIRGQSPASEDRGRHPAPIVRGQRTNSSPASPGLGGSQARPLEHCLTANTRNGELSCKLAETLLL